MTPRDFVYWLQGYLEISGARVLEEYEVSVIKDHLKLVFSKETPDRTVTPFLGNDREVFDEKYIKDALGLDFVAERKKMNEELADLSKIPICGAKPWMHEPNCDPDTLGEISLEPIPAKFDSFFLSSDNLPPLPELQTRLDRMTNYPLNVDEGSFSYPLVKNIVGCSC